MCFSNRIIIAICLQVRNLEFESIIGTFADTKTKKHTSKCDIDATIHQASGNAIYSLT